MLGRLELILSGCVSKSAVNSDRVKSLNENGQTLKQERALMDVIWHLGDVLSRSLRNSCPWLFIGPSKAFHGGWCEHDGCASWVCFAVFIARQHCMQSAMHADCDIVLPILSRLSVRPMLVLNQNEWTYRHTFLTFWYGRGIILVFDFCRPTAVTKIPSGTPQRGR